MGRAAKTQRLTALALKKYANNAAVTAPLHDGGGLYLRKRGSALLPSGRWTAHDLRRTSAALMAGLGVSGDVIDECLNHIIESRVRRTYIRDRRAAEQALAFDAPGAHLGSLVSTRSTLPPRRTVKLQRNDVDVTA